MVQRQSSRRLVHHRLDSVHDTARPMRIVRRYLVSSRNRIILDRTLRLLAIDRLTRIAHAVHESRLWPARLCNLFCVAPYRLYDCYRLGWNPTLAPSYSPPRSCSACVRLIDAGDHTVSHSTPSTNTIWRDCLLACTRHWTDWPLRQNHRNCGYQRAR